MAELAFPYTTKDVARQLLRHYQLLRPSFTSAFGGTATTLFHQCHRPSPSRERQLVKGEYSSAAQRQTLDKPRPRAGYVLPLD